MPMSVIVSVGFEAIDDTISFAVNSSLYSNNNNCKMYLQQTIF